MSRPGRDADGDPRILFDLTPAVRPGMPVWPGDTPPEREVLLDLARGDNITLSTLRTTVHLGAHADAPSHYGREGRTIDAQDPGRYLGRCRVIHAVADAAGLVRPEGLPEDLAATRVLLRTGVVAAEGVFPREFPALAPGLIDWLADRGVVLVGTDAPSVDPFKSRELPAHRRCLERDVAILEGLALADVPEGRYTLVALPLKLTGFDASPVRAVLCAEEGWR